MASLARTILEEHLVRGELTPGTEIAISIDQTLAQDATGTMAMMQFELFGHERVEVDTAVVYIDHNILQIDFKNPDDHRFLQAMAAKYGVWYSRPGQRDLPLHPLRALRRAREDARRRRQPHDAVGLGGDDRDRGRRPRRGGLHGRARL